MTNNRLNQVCADVYRQVHFLWLALEDTLPTWDHKYSILYGPPVERPPMFVIGLNPGGNADQEVETSWPEVFWYAEDSSARMPRQLQALFESAGHNDAFQRSTGANINFFRTPQIAKNAAGTGWKNVPLQLRRLLERYCRLQLEKLVAAMDPQLLFLMGWETLDQLVPGKDYLDKLVLRGRWLAVESRLDGRPVIAVKHPTGGYGWSSDDRAAIGAWLGRKLPPLLTSA